MNTIDGLRQLEEEETALIRQLTRQKKMNIQVEDEKIETIGQPAEKCSTLQRDIEKAEERLAEHREKIKKYTDDEKSKYVDFHTVQKSRMADDASRDAFNKFWENVKQKFGDSHEGRFIQAILGMGSSAAKYFECFAKYDAHVTFANSYTLDLLINGELETHPRAIENLYNHTEVNQTKNDLERILEKTKKLQNLKTEPDKEAYRTSVTTTIGTAYMRMCTREQIKAWTAKIKKILEGTETPEDLHLFDNMTPMEAFRLRAAFDSRYSDRTIAVGVSLAKHLRHGGNVMKTVDCIEAVATLAIDKVSPLILESEAIQNSTNTLEVKKSLFEGLKKRFNFKGSVERNISEKKKDFKHRLMDEAAVLVSNEFAAFEAEIEEIKKYCHGVHHKMQDPLTAAYHFRKHVDGTVLQEVGKPIKELSMNEQRDIYFKQAPGKFFVWENDQRTSYSQNGLIVISTWRRISTDGQRDYFGTKSSHIGGNLHVNTHYIILPSKSQQKALPSRP